MPPIPLERRRVWPGPGRFGRSLALAAALLLALGCTTPAPRPAPVASARAQPVEPPRPAAPASAALPTRALPGSAAPPAPPAPPAAPAAASAPYGEAVAARFPDPPVRYATPAFQPGREDFTRNDEIGTWLRGLVRTATPADATTVRLIEAGRSQLGVPIEALLFTRVANPSPEALAEAGRATVLLVGQQHGDEPAGAEALLVVAESLARGPLARLLDRINVVVLPRANPDGAAASRRVTASGIDMNRDHLLLKTPESQAQARLARDWQPVVVVDAHEYTVVGRYLEKFGAVQRFDALFQYATVANLPEFVSRASEEWFRRPLLAQWKSAGLSAEWYYTTSTDLADRKVSMGGVRPDTGRNVNGLRNAVSLLVETRGVGIGRLHLARRVHTHVTAISSVLDSAAQRSADLVKLRRFVDSEVGGKACQGEAVLDAAATPSEYALTMIDPATGADRSVAVAWDSALALRPLKTRARPCGYWLGPEQAEAVRHLRALGVQVQRVDENGAMRAETFRELSREAAVRSDVRGNIDDAGGTVAVTVATTPMLLDVAPGAWYVGLDQPLANLVIAALEPDTQDSFVAHRIVDAADRVARVMLRPTARLSDVP